LLSADITKANSGYSATQNSLIRGGVEVTKQYYQTDGKITSWSGVALAVLPASNNGINEWGETAGLISDNKNIASAGLAIIEQSARGKGVNSLDWVNVAGAAINNQRGSGKFLDSANNLQWGEVATRTLISAGLSVVVSNRRGSEAGLNFFADQLGNNIKAGLETQKQNSPEYLKEMQTRRDKYANAQRIAAEAEQTNRDFETFDRAFAATTDEGTIPGIPRYLQDEIDFAEAERIQGQATDNGIFSVGIGRQELPENLRIPNAGLINTQDKGYIFDENGLQVGPTVFKERTGLGTEVEVEPRSLYEQGLRFIRDNIDKPLKEFQKELYGDFTQKLDPFFKELSELKNKELAAIKAAGEKAAIEGDYFSAALSAISSAVNEAAFAPVSGLGQLARIFTNEQISQQTGNAAFNFLLNPYDTTANAVDYFANLPLEQQARGIASFSGEVIGGTAAFNAARVAANATTYASKRVLRGALESYDNLDLGLYNFLIGKPEFNIVPPSKIARFSSTYTGNPLESSFVGPHRVDVVPNTPVDDFVGPLIGKSGYKSTTELADDAFLRYQRYTDDAYDAALRAEAKGRLVIPEGVARETVIGQKVDRAAQARLKNWIRSEGIGEGAGELTSVNRWLRDPSGSGSYRIPDFRIDGAGSIMDGTIGYKWSNTPQVRDFFNFSQGSNVTIVRPQQLGGSYSILPQP